LRAVWYINPLFHVQTTLVLTPFKNAFNRRENLEFWSLFPCFGSVFCRFCRRAARSRRISSRVD
jgi:hypothetical protein